MPEDPVIVEVRAELEALIPGFLESRAQDLLTLQAALQAEDLATIALVGHKLKGTAGSYGFRAIEQIGRALEAAAKASDLPELGRLVARYAETLSQTQVVLVR